MSIALNLGFAVAELAFGLIANSLALVADALHDASDAVALGLPTTSASSCPSARPTADGRSAIARCES